MNIKTDTEPLTCEIVGFWASERPDLCQLFLKGHNKILTDHGLTDLISTDDYWVDDNCLNNYYNVRGCDKPFAANWNARRADLQPITSIGGTYCKWPPPK